MHPVILQIGPFTIYSFGLMVALGLLAAAYVTSLEFRRIGLDADLVPGLTFWAAVGGIGGARLFLIFEEPDKFLADPLAVLFSGAGFVWYGGFFGGLAAALAFIRRHNLPILRVLDCVAPALPLGHAIGRIGCHLAGDGDWGTVTTLPWGVAYQKAIIGWPHPAGVVVHPTPIYEAIAYTLIFAFLWARRTRSDGDGTQLWLYLVLAGIARFAVEFVRINRPWVLGLTLAQWTSLLLILVGTIFLLNPRMVTRLASPANRK